MARRRKLHGKKLLVVSAGIVGISFIGCDEETVANLVAPDAGPPMDAGMDSGPDDGGSFLDAPVANLLPPMDSGFVEDAASSDGSPGDGGDTDGG